MRINSISNNYVSMNSMKGKNPSFGTAYVTLAKANLANVIAKNVDSYNRGDFAKMYPESTKSAQRVIDNVNATMRNLNGKIKTVKDLIEKTDLYVLAAGSGSRFKPMAAAVASLRDKGEQFNKISVPFELGKGQKPLTMLDIPLSMGRFFADKKGYRKIVAEQPTGSFGDIVLNYIKSGKEPKDVVVCCGDNVFDMKSEDMLDYIVRTINNPKKQLGVVGVARTPYEVANRFGVLAVGKQDRKTGTFPLKGFVEKPELEIAKELATAGGDCIANTGMFVIKKETMVKLLNALKTNPNLIAKNDKEKYDFANATKWARNLNGTAASDVLMVKTWEDVGEPQAYHNWTKEMQNNHYLSNFTPKRRMVILDAMKSRVTDDTIQFSLKPKGLDTVDGINIKA